jgi:EKC/KEOPS complex subunit PCC1/LAGE3
MASADPFSHTLMLRIPFPTAHLARTALRALAVDKELSSLVTRTYSLDSPSSSSPETHGSNEAGQTVLVVKYAATTNRMLRVSVNGFFDGLQTVLHVMEELDLDVYDGEVKESLDRVQGLEDGIK